MRTSVVLAGLAAVLPELVSAHGYVSDVNAGGKWGSGSNPNWYYLPSDQVPKTNGWKALNQDNGFVEPNSFKTSDIACHKSAKAGETFFEVAAGSSLTVYWNTWPDTHKGPVINYIAPYSSSPGSLSFSKISQSGLNGGTWASDALIAANNSATVTIPSKLAAGNYVLRHEIIALHAAGSANGAQAYPQCINLKVTGGGGVTPSGGVPATSFYTATDPGILYSLYGGSTSYQIPGPAVWTGAN